MVYREYMEDWHFRHKAPLSTQVYPRQKSPQQKKKKKKGKKRGKKGVHTHQGLILRGEGQSLGFPLTHDQFIFPPPPLHRAFYELFFPFMQRQNEYIEQTGEESIILPTLYSWVSKNANNMSDYESKKEGKMSKKV